LVCFIKSIIKFQVHLKSGKKVTGTLYKAWVSLWLLCLLALPWLVLCFISSCVYRLHGQGKVRALNHNI
jgi:hypothetical protein